MERDRRAGNAARALAPALLVLALVGLVAVASTGSTPVGTRESRLPADALLDSVLSFGLLLLVASAALFVYALFQRNEMRAELARRRPRRLTFVGFTVVMLSLTLLAYAALRDLRTRESLEELQRRLAGLEAEPAGPSDGGETMYDPEFAWAPVLVLTAFGAIAVAVWYLQERRRRPPVADDALALAAAVALVLDETLDDLRAEQDARRAVIAAYARLERVLAAHELGRKPAEAPEEYLVRILPLLELEHASVRRLTDLFTRAKFSLQDVDADMKDEAIEALATVRDELRAAAERRRALELVALEAAVPQP